MKMEQTECSKTSTYKIQTPGNYPEENKQRTEHGESLKSRNCILHQFSGLRGEYGSEGITLGFDSLYKKIGPKRKF
jgi:hypothetical protein